MTTIDIDALLEPVRTARSEGDALRHLLRANAVALQAVRRMLDGVDNPAKVAELSKEVDKLLADMTLDSPKVETTLRDSRSKAPIERPPPEKHPDAPHEAEKKTVR